MGRYSDDERDYYSKKKKKKSSRDHSPSSIDSYSSRSKKSKKSKKSRHRSRSSSYDRSYRKSRSRSRDRHRRSRSRSYKRSRASRSRSRGRYRRSRSYTRRRSRSYSRSRRSRSHSKRSRSKDKSTSQNSSPPSSQKDEFKPELVPGFSEMTPSEQAELRLQMAIKAAAAADKKITNQILGNNSLTFEERQNLSTASADINAEGFQPQTFVSSKSMPSSDMKPSTGHGDAIFGLLTTLPPLPTKQPEKISTDPRAIMHENLYVSSEVKMNRWIEKVAKRKQQEDNR